MKRTQRLSNALVVTCNTKQHHVRLDPARVWASATCPRCRTAVDPTRLRRAFRLLVLAYRFSASSPGARATLWLSWLYLSVVAVAALGMWKLGHVWWPMTMLLFSPRWLFLVPFLGLIPAAVVFHRRSTIPVFVGLLIVIGPLMGFRTGWRRLVTRGGSAVALRVTSFNMAGGKTLTLSPPAIMVQTNSDILALQDCRDDFANRVRVPREVPLYTHTSHGQCVLSRYPIDSVEMMDLANLNRAGATGVAARYWITVLGTPVLITNLHLDSPTAWLAPLTGGDVAEGMGQIITRENLGEIESRRVRRWIDEAGDSVPSLVVGDFNMPVESVIYQKHWSDLRNAFSVAGFGFGFTRYAGPLVVRIDHVLVNDGWRVLKAYRGPDYGSDHRPMIADLVPPWQRDPAEFQPE